MPKKQEDLKEWLPEKVETDGRKWRTYPKKVKHHISYGKNKTVKLTRSEHFHTHFGFGRCYMCRTKGKRKRYFAPVNPKNGKEYNDTFIHPQTGNLCHSWFRRGKWILLCEECKPKAIGVRVTRENMR